MQNNMLAPSKQILSILIGFWQARAVAAITEVDIPELLSSGALHVEELARLTKTNASALFRIMRALESVGIFTQPSPFVFANTATSGCLRKDAPDSQQALVLSCLSHGNGLFDGWDDFGYSMSAGLPALNKIYGHDIWEFYRQHPKANTIFNEMMRSLTGVMTPAITAAYDWSHFPVIADIGGGIGTQLVSILNAYPSCSGILFDQPHLGAVAISHDRMEILAGDFFQSAPTGADAYLLRWIIHDWAEPQAATILGSLYRSMKPTAHLILAELVIPEGPAFGFGKWLDLQMLVNFGGRERTEVEYRTLLSKSGFRLENVITTASPLSLLIAKRM
jgi:O-methyltransferase domain